MHNNKWVATIANLAMRFFMAVFPIVAGLVACGGGLEAVGSVNGACYGNGTCDMGLVCAPTTRICVATDGGTGNGPDSGAPIVCDNQHAGAGCPCYGNGSCDMGAACNATTKKCETPDSGVVVTDSGTTIVDTDAGVASTDGGVTTYADASSPTPVPNSCTNAMGGAGFKNVNSGSLDLLVGKTWLGGSNETDYWGFGSGQSIVDCGATGFYMRSEGWNAWIARSQSDRISWCQANISCRDRDGVWYTPQHLTGDGLNCECSWDRQ